MADEPKKPAKPLPSPPGMSEPSFFVISPVEDGAYSLHLPTITAVYVGRKAPDPQVLARINGGAVDRDDTAPGGVQLSIFITPPPSDTESFTDAFAYEMDAPDATTDLFMDNIVKIKCFVFAVSADDYYFKCKIDVESSNTLESTCDYRLLH